MPRSFHASPPRALPRFVSTLFLALRQDIVKKCHVNTHRPPLCGCKVTNTLTAEFPASKNANTPIVSDTMSCYGPAAFTTAARLPRHGGIGAKVIYQDVLRLSVCLLCVRVAPVRGALCGLEDGAFRALVHTLANTHRRKAREKEESIQQESIQTTTPGGKTRDGASSKVQTYTTTLRIYK